MEKQHKKYLKKVFGTLAILGGTFLVVEHIWSWGEVAFFDFIGHEWLGVILIIFGIILNTNFSRARLSAELRKLFKKK